MTKHQVYLGLGSNLGNREAVLLQAIKLIDERVGQVLRRSSFIETEPWGFESDNKFLNAAVCCETELSPRQVLQTRSVRKQSTIRTVLSILISYFMTT